MKLIMASGLALALGITAAAAQGSSSSSSSGTTAGGKVMQMTQADCQATWNRIDTSKTGSVSEAQAKAYVTGFKAVDKNGDGKLSSSEFMTACEKGLVHDGASSGTSSGTTGSGAAGTGTTR